MKVLNNISPLPFYEDISMQHHHKSYAFGQTYPLICENTWLLPFQFTAALSFNFSNDFSNDFFIPRFAKIDSFNIKLTNIKTGAVDDITSDMYAGGFSIKYLANTYNSCYLFKYTGTKPISKLHDGRYILAIQVVIEGTSYNFSSDVITACENVECYTKIDYRNRQNLNVPWGIIDFEDNFSFRCYLDAEIARPKYLFEEEATSRGGYTFIERVISKKAYTFTSPAPEYLCDALRLIKLCDTKYITDKYGREYWPISFDLNVSWQDQGDLAAIECEFETDNIIQNIGNL